MVKVKESVGWGRINVRIEADDIAELRAACRRYYVQFPRGGYDTRLVESFDGRAATGSRWETC